METYVDLESSITKKNSGFEAFLVSQTKRKQGVFLCVKDRTKL